MKLKNTFLVPYTLLIWIYIILIFVLHILYTVTCRPFAKDPELFSIRATDPLFYIGFKLFGITLVINGQENIPKDTNFILVANHQSILDIPILMYGIRTKIVFIAKEELLKVPLLGWQIKALGHFTINRSNAKSSVTQLRSIEKRLENHEKSVILFPEGTRSTTGKIAEFKKGAFMMAVNSGTTLLPCHLEGTGKIANKKQLLIHPGTITLTIHPPIPVTKIENLVQAKAKAEELRLEIQQIIEH